MIIAQDKRKTNIIEYVLYMWQVEDLIRACNFDIEVLQTKIISKFGLNEDRMLEVRDWYKNLIAMMQNESCEKTGHIVILQELVKDLNSFHIRMLKAESFVDYTNYYRLCAASLEEFKTKAKREEMSDIEAAITAMYGILMMRLKGQEISEDTAKAANAFSRMLAKLSQVYLKVESGEAEENF